MRIGGLVLAGGRSRRFGREKAMETFAGQPLIARVNAVLQCSCASVAIGAPRGSGAASWALARRLPVLSDAPEVGRGPLAGVLAGLRWAREMGFGALVTTPCDTPQLPLDMVARLAGAHGAMRGAVAADAEGRLHPLCALWPVAVEGRLAQALGAPRHPPARELARDLGFRVEVLDATDAFLNINTTDDLRRTGAHLASRCDQAE